MQSSRFLAFAPLLDPLIQRLQHSRVHRGDDIDCCIEFFFRHPRFPCVRKAPVNSWITEAHHRDGEADEHLFPLGKTFDGMRVAVKSSEIRFLQNSFLLLEKRGRVMLVATWSLAPDILVPRLICPCVARPVGFAARFPELSLGGASRATAPTHHFPGG